MAQLQSLIRFIGRLTIAATHMLAAALLAWYLLRLYPGDRWLSVRLGSYFAPWLFMLLFPALGVALLGRRRWLAGIVILLILLFGTRFWFLFRPGAVAASANPHPADLRVMTFNVHYANRNVADISRLIETEQPDIIALQEVTEPLAANLLPELSSGYPYQLVHDSGLALLSRYPLAEQTASEEIWRTQHALVETPVGVVTVWNLHPPPAVKQAGWQVQREILAAVGDQLKAEKAPLIVLGDLNTTDQAENYEVLANHLIDVHHAAGRGFGFTFPEPDVLALLPWYARPFEMLKPVVRIDHVLINKGLEPREIHVVPDGFGSDHRPVVATLQGVD